MAARYSEASRPREIDLALARLGKCPVADCLRTPRARGKPYLTVRSIQPSSHPLAPTLRSGTQHRHHSCESSHSPPPRPPATPFQGGIGCMTRKAPESGCMTRRCGVRVNDPEKRVHDPEKRMYDPEMRGAGERPGEAGA
eukprot:1179453-Prorocentrum_minimum.AAC.1